jgi:hypothetical protein
MKAVPITPSKSLIVWWAWTWRMILVCISMIGLDMLSEWLYCWARGKSHNINTIDSKDCHI